MTPGEKIEKLYAAWDMMHFSCDNPDHKEAYVRMAEVFFEETFEEEQ